MQHGAAWSLSPQGGSEGPATSISHTAPRSVKHHHSPPPAFVFTTRPSNTGPAFPGRFRSLEAARAHCQDFFSWYNHEHRHGGLGLHTAADVHHGQAPAVQAQRGPRPGRRLPRPPRALRQQATRPAEIARNLLDQSAPEEGSRHSVKATRRRPGQVDRFRGRGFAPARKTAMCSTDLRNELSLADQRSPRVARRVPGGLSRVSLASEHGPRSGPS